MLTKTIEIHFYERWAAGLSVFLLPSLALVLPSGYSWGAALLMLLGVYTVARSHDLSVSRIELIVFFLFISYFLLWGVGEVMKGGGVRELDRPSKFLLALFSIFTIKKIRPSVTWLWCGVACGAIGAGLLALYEIYVLNAGRANGFAQTNQFGKISLLLSVLSAAALFGGVAAKQKKLLVLLGLGFFFGLVAALFSGSRGAWLGLAAVVPVFFLVSAGVYGAKVTFSMGSILVAMMVSVLWGFGSDTLTVRVNALLIDLAKYFEHSDSMSSIGVRLELWRVAPSLFAHQPLFGLGEVGMASMIDDLVANGDAPAYLSSYGHLHNELLDVAVKQGVIGLVIYLLIFLLPCVVFIVEWRRRLVLDTRLSLVIAFMLLSVLYFIFGFAQTNFGHNSSAVIFPFLYCVIIGFISYKGDDKL